MRLLVYTINKGGSYVQRTVPRSGLSAWEKFKEFISSYSYEQHPESIKLTSAYEAGENEFVDSFISALPINRAEPKIQSKHEYIVPVECLEQCAGSLLEIDHWSEDNFLELGINPVQLEIDFKFSWNLPETKQYKFPDWYRDYESRSQMLVWLGSKTLVCPYIVFPYDTASKDQESCLPAILSSLPFKCSNNNFRIYEKAKTTDAYRSGKLSSTDKAYIESCKPA